MPHNIYMSNGGWKSGGGGPWGGGQGPWGQGGGSGGGGGGQQPDLEELLKRSQDRLKQVMPGSGLPGPLIFFVGAIAAAVLAFFAFTFRVDPDEAGVVLRFGKFVRQEPAGLHFRYPPPIEEVRKPKITRQNIIEVGFRSTAGGRSFGGAGSDQIKESQMLTGDENIVDVNFVVFWRISNVELYLFNIQNPENTVKEVAESAMREIVGQSDIQPILTEARGKTEQAVQKLMQDTLDYYKSGIRVDQVQLQKVDPPQQVLAAFIDVQNAKNDNAKAQNDADGYARRVVNDAKGEAQKILQEAEGYQQRLIAEATGESQRFLKVLAEYRRSPEVVRRRMFIETMERVLAGADKIIIDSNGKGGQGVVPFLPLQDLQRRPAAPATSPRQVQ